jgi:hypothetical protein
MMNLVKSLVAGASCDKTSLPEDVELPLCSVEEMVKIEETLQDQMVFNALVRLI